MAVASLVSQPNKFTAESKRLDLRKVIVNANPHGWVN